MRYYFYTLDGGSSGAAIDAENVMISAGILWTGYKFRDFDAPCTAKRLFIDSGGFTFATRKKSPPRPKTYAAFVEDVINQYPKAIVGAASMDHIPNEDKYNRELRAFNLPWIAVIHGDTMEKFRRSLIHNFVEFSEERFKIPTGTTLLGKTKKEHWLMIGGLKKQSPEGIVRRINYVKNYAPFSPIHALGLTVDALKKTSLIQSIDSADSSVWRFDYTKGVDFLPKSDTEKLINFQSYRSKVDSLFQTPQPTLFNFLEA